MVKWYPKSKLGKISFWIAIISFILMYIQYWAAMIFEISMPIFTGLLVIIAICTSGVLSIISIIKYKERAILIFLSALIGLLGFVMIIGEFLFPH